MADEQIQSVLFCCTGNVFRSMTAEYALRRVMRARGVELRIGSAGTQDKRQVVWPEVRNYLERQGLDVSTHERRTITRALLDQTDLVIAMSTDHESFLWTAFQCRAPLFLDACGHGQLALPDVDEAVPDYTADRVATLAHVRATIDRIIEATPRLADRICMGDAQLRQH